MNGLGPYGQEVVARRPDPYTAFSTRLLLEGENPQQEFVRGLGSAFFPTPRAVRGGVAQLLGTAFGIPEAWDVNREALDALVPAAPRLPGAVAEMARDPRGLGTLMGMAPIPPRLARTASFDELVHGEPISLWAYHGTPVPELVRREGFKVPPRERNPLVPRIAGRLGREGLMGRGVYFTDSKRIAGNYGDVLPVQVDLAKPYVLGNTYLDELIRLDPEALAEEGYDALIAKGGKYGLTGESYRQGAVFDPEKIRIAGQPFTTSDLQMGAKVRDKATGELGTVRGVRPFTGVGVRQYHPEGADGFVKVRWAGRRGVSKPRTDPNVYNHTLDIVPPRGPR